MKIGKDLYRNIAETVKVVQILQYIMRNLDIYRNAIKSWEIVQICQYIMFFGANKLLKKNGWKPPVKQMLIGT